MYFQPHDISNDDFLKKQPSINSANGLNDDTVSEDSKKNTVNIRNKMKANDRKARTVTRTCILYIVTLSVAQLPGCLATVAARPQWLAQLPVYCTHKSQTATLSIAQLSTCDTECRPSVYILILDLVQILLWLLGVPYTGWPLCFLLIYFPTLSHTQ